MLLICSSFNRSTYILKQTPEIVENTRLIIRCMSSFAVTGSAKTFSFTYLQRKKSDGVRSGDRAGLLTGPPSPIKLSLFNNPLSYYSRKMNSGTVQQKQHDMIIINRTFLTSLLKLFWRNYRQIKSFTRSRHSKTIFTAT